MPDPAVIQDHSVGFSPSLETLETLNSPDLAVVSSIRHAFFPKCWGDIFHADLVVGGARSLLARDHMAKHLKCDPSALLFCHQIHSSDVKIVTDVWDFTNPPQADAMVTNKPGIALGILTADCVSVLLVDPCACVIGAAHAGWRGAVAGVLENTIDAMESLGAQTSNIRAALGPCIWQSSYEVGPEFYESFVEHDGSSVVFFCANDSGRYLFDLSGFVTDRLGRKGVSAITPSPADTYSDQERYHSYRKAVVCGHARDKRMVSAISLA